MNTLGSLNFNYSLLMKLLMALLMVSGIKSQTLQESTLYVLDFKSDSNTIDVQTLARITSEFETALINSNLCNKVLERKKVDELIAQHRQEEIISTNFDFKSFKDSLLQKHYKANGYISGEVDHDINSGDIIITVTVTAFTSVIIAKQSITLKPGLLMDAPTRKQKMERLVESLRASKSQSSSPFPRIKLEPLDIRSSDIMSIISNVLNVDIAPATPLEPLKKSSKRLCYIAGGAAVIAIAWLILWPDPSVEPALLEISKPPGRP